MLSRLMYDGLFGGIEAFSTAHFILVNGFSNKFFGWGGEDDDLFERYAASDEHLRQVYIHIALMLFIL